MKHIGEFLKGKRLLQSPALVYPANNPPTKSKGGGRLGVLPDIGPLLARARDYRPRESLKAEIEVASWAAY